ncbi:MAG: hypothetical protein J1E81_02835 [Eubacterium sp.]|nr:hypothetical protein [Eubacterium sp.]
MNLDANIQKMLLALLRKWKLIIIFALLGTIVAYVFTANFTTQTYTSSVEFLAYAEDPHEITDSATSTQTQTASYTSKMNYAMKMLDTYVELFKTNKFNQSVANEINEKYGSSYSASSIRNCMKIEIVSGTSMFKITVSTTNADMSFQIAQQLEKSIPEKMKNTNGGVVQASIEDSAVIATTSESPQYVKKCLIGFLAGVVLSAAYVILRDLLDVRIKSADELAERYDIPVLGAIPEFEIKSGQTAKAKANTNTKRGE